MDTSEISPVLTPDPPSPDEEMLITNLLISHDPDGRDIDPELLLRAVKIVSGFATSSEARFGTRSKDRQTEVVGSLQEFIRQAVDKISREMLYNHHRGENLHTRTMNLLDLLGNYQWSEKTMLVLLSLALIYCEFWLVIDLRDQNPMAKSISLLKQLPNNLKPIEPRLRSLNRLIWKMVEVSELVAKLDRIPISEAKIEPKLIDTTKRYMYLAVYWVARSAIRGSCHISDLRAAVKPKRVCRTSTAAAAWELLSLNLRLSKLSIRFQKLVEACHWQTEEKIYAKLVSLFKEKRVDNQEVLRVLFSLKDNLPFKKSISQEKVGISEFEDKVVILFISKPELPKPEELLLLHHQMYTNPTKGELRPPYEIVYVPISDYSPWTDSEERTHDFISNLLPWYSIHNPELLSSAVVKSIKQELNFKDEPISIMIDSKGSVTNLNVIDMVKIWGSEAYPFSASREEELWKAERSTFGLLFHGIDPLLSNRIREGRAICIFGGEDIQWIREFHSRIAKTILAAGVQLDIVYVGRSNLTSQVRNILLTEIPNPQSPSTITSLSISSIQFFWIRLDSIKKSIFRQRNKANVADRIFQHVSGLLEFDKTGSGWAVFGDGKSVYTLMLRGEEVMECLDMFPKWRWDVEKWGLVGAMRMALEPPETDQPCRHSESARFEDKLLGKALFCGRCKRPMKGFIVYE